MTLIIKNVHASIRPHLFAYDVFRLYLLFVLFLLIPRTFSAKMYQRSHIHPSIFYRYLGLGRGAAV